MHLYLMSVYHASCSANCIIPRESEDLNNNNRTSNDKVHIYTFITSYNFLQYKLHPKRKMSVPRVWNCLKRFILNHIFFLPIELLGFVLTWMHLWMDFTWSLRSLRVMCSLSIGFVYNLPASICSSTSLNPWRVFFFSMAGEVFYIFILRVNVKSCIFIQEVYKQNLYYAVF